MDKSYEHGKYIVWYDVLKFPLKNQQTEKKNVIM